MRNTTPSIPLSETVDLYTVGSENHDRKYLIDILIHARWAWKELFWTTLYSVKSKIVPVTRVGDYLSYIPFPPDMSRFYNICIEDAGSGLRALMMDDSFNTLPVPSVPATGACSACGEHDQLAACIQDFTGSTMDITIDGQVYTERVWKKLMPTGDVLEVKTTPVEIEENGVWKIIMRTTENLLTTLDIKPCGCIDDTQINRFKLIEQCGLSGILPNVEPMVKLLSQPYQKWGAVKLENGRIWIHGNCPKYVMLCYQSNGECPGEEIMVPEIAVDTLQYGIDYKCKRFSPRVLPQIKRELKNIWEEAKDELSIFLNPIRQEDFLDSQMSIAVWGNAGTGLKDDTLAMPSQKPASQSQPAAAVYQPLIPPVTTTTPSTGGGTGGSSNSNNLVAINEVHEVAIAGDPDAVLVEGATQYVLEALYVIKKSIEVSIDGAEIPELETTRRLACTILYLPTQVTIQFNQPLIAEQVVKITGFAWQP